MYVIVSHDMSVQSHHPLAHFKLSTFNTKYFDNLICKSLKPSHVIPGTVLPSRPFVFDLSSLYVWVYMYSNTILQLF